jgi:hypothetical protein
VQHRIGWDECAERRTEVLRGWLLGQEKESKKSKDE